MVGDVVCDVVADVVGVEVLDVVGVVVLDVVGEVVWLDVRLVVWLDVAVVVLVVVGVVKIRAKRNEPPGPCTRSSHLRYMAQTTGIPRWRRVVLTGPLEEKGQEFTWWPDGQPAD